MVKTEKLNEAIAASGKTKKFLAKQLDITPQTLYNKATNLTSFNRLEREELAKQLGLTEEQQAEILGG